ncbi:MAG TPA: TlpA disulfide reductase family protein, partial [Pyrinomonadaceae bacterium]|nr:TlpA disulfide reductase family protein [Pyrinomonadaceae bacterium]
YAIVSWIDNNNGRKNLSAYAGKVVVLDFYATWCQPCRLSIPKLNALQQQLGPDGLTVIGLNVGGADDRIKVNAFARELNIQYQLGFPDKALTDLFFADDETIPQTFVFSRNGQLTKRFVGFDEKAAAELEHTIELELKRTKD